MVGWLVFLNSHTGRDTLLDKRGKWERNHSPVVTGGVTWESKKLIHAWMDKTSF